MIRRRLFTRPRAKPLAPWLFWRVLQSLFKQIQEPAQLANAMDHLIPRGNPGAGLLRGRENIAKTLTYRATYVPGGFNVARDTMRKAWADAANAAYVDGRLSI